ncbi:hypothetical protein KFL_002670020 [Klebsormidium nitens]|uniref:Root cap family protein n=1 Tax=Klebsormidium nitens TaxID=105231 RepID=A0A1Y1IA88_KLENI|nr:hypothetical protein KFL_002670020 [Klebsormidium nitens]|eukprot:GAQ86041.1 hypothetical protein KFL_002670020 [Klebsormidium nitens]
MAVAKYLILSLTVFFAVSMTSSAQRIGPFDCEVCQLNANTGVKSCSFFYYEGVNNDCNNAAGFSCNACPAGTPGKDPDCACSKKCQIDPIDKSTLWHCECNVKKQGTACSDPHFRGAFGIEYDFHGLPNKHFSLVTDKDINVNAHFIGQDGKATGFDGTWISALGFKWNEGANERELTVEVKQSADLSTNESPFVFRLGDRELAPGANSTGRTLYDDVGLTVRRYADASSYYIDIADHLNITVAAAEHDHPHGNHIDIRIEKLYVTETVHGALGQTFAESRRDALRAAAADVGTAERFDASDVIEGKDVDYMTSGLLATDSKFNRYVAAAQSAANVLKMNVMRRLLSDRLDVADAVPVETVGFACDNMDGRLKCRM